ncbi:transglycosylase family protein [Nocardioides sp. CER19]|uniref:transglycosylase family protein n=1 Tax=Nocardioides sp. CER19 TaxID=3038538 RepID=UPI002448813C|nr:transglycosylase family protein [Nocardioides sp. CER19]MDH2415524.1 transglycosylase family protein [Nocardioides sp. CER19]
MRMRTLLSSTVLAAATITPVVAVASPAHAATTRTWQRLANCESGGRWHLNTHNGYYGGLQISGSTWRGYGGRRFARLPSRATKAQQIKVAERIKRGQGWGAWPACSARIGVR